MVFDYEHENTSRSALTQTVASNVGCMFKTLRRWNMRKEQDAFRRDGETTDERAPVKQQENEVKELRRANEILRNALAYFALTELDRRPK